MLSNFHNRIIGFTTALSLSILIYACFYPGLNGPFLLDDTANIYENERVALTAISTDQLYIAATTSLEGYPFERGLAFISFALNHYYSGLKFDRFDIKTTNLIIHTSNAIIIYNILLAIFSVSLKNSTLSPTLLAFVTTLAWACHPIQISSVLYAVQRMTLLATTFTLFGCYIYIKHRLTPVKTTRTNFQNIKLCLSLVLCVAIGFHFKETAVLLPSYILAIEIIIRQSTPLNRSVEKVVITFGILVAATAITYLLYSVENIRDGYISRNFSLEERLLTEPRVLFWYLKIILLPDLSAYSLFLDDYPISTSLTSPLTTLISLIAWVVLGFISITTKHRHLMVSTLIWFLGGHLIESTFIHLEIAFEHRNYLPSLAPISLFLITLTIVVKKTTTSPIIPYIAIATITAFLSFLCVLRAAYWGDNILFLNQSVHNRPHSERALNAAGMYWAATDPLRALDLLNRSSANNPSAVSPLTSQYSILSTVYSLYDDPRPIALGDQFHLSVRNNWSRDEIGVKLDALETKILERLKHFAISAQVMKVIDINTLCATQQYLGCSNVKTLITWVETALNNPRKPDLYTPLLKFQKSRLLAADGQINDAISLMQSVIQEHPDNEYYKIKLGQLFDQLGMKAQSQALLKTVSPQVLKRYLPK